MSTFNLFGSTFSDMGPKPRTTKATKRKASASVANDDEDNVRREGTDVVTRADTEEFHL